MKFHWLSRAGLEQDLSFKMDLISLKFITPIKSYDG